MTKLADVRARPGVIDGAASGDLDLSCDVCVVGTGAGGAVAAATLAAAGLDVIMVEEGGYYSAEADFTAREKDVVAKLYQEAEQRTTVDGAIAVLHGRTVGGSTVVNWTTSFRTPEHVVLHWAKKHAVSGFTHADLVPHWDWIEKRLAVREVAEGELNANNRKLLEGCRAMGWRVEKLRRNVASCLQSGFCGLGCPANAKRSMLVTLVPDAIVAGARLLFRARVDRLELSGASAARAAGTLFASDGRAPSGKRFTVRAKRFVLSGGALHTSALLLRSGVTAGGAIGERVFIHPVICSVATYDDGTPPWEGAPQSVASHHFAERGDAVGVFLEAAPVYPALTGATMPGWGAEHASRMGEVRRSAVHVALAIDGFHDDVPGGVVRVRRSGAPALDYPIPAPVWEALRFGQRRLAEAQLASGARRVRTLHDPWLEMTSKDDVSRIESMPWKPSAVAVFTAHLMGGCRMGDDPRRSVVRSEDLRLHDLDNVWVIDGSVFPTSLGVNPQESIYGLARLMATRLAAKKP